MEEDFETITELLNKALDPTTDGETQKSCREQAIAMMRENLQKSKDLGAITLEQYKESLESIASLERISIDLYEIYNDIK